MRSPLPLALSALTAATAGISLAQPLPVVPSWRSLQAAENCPCEACVEDSTGDGQIAQCEAQGMDCSCYTDCALCRLCTKFNSSPHTCMEVCRGGCAAATPVPSCFDVQSRTTEIDTKCCDAAWGEECDGDGIPSSCDFGCSSIFLPFWADCASDLGFASDSRLIGVVSLCQASATACIHSPCANGGECTAVPPYMGGFRCNCAEGYSGDDCSEGGPEFIVPEPSLRELAGERLLIGTAANIARIASGQYAEYTAILRSDFSILTPENCMKMTQTQPLQGQWDFADADALLSFASSNNILVRAHNLIWTGRNPDWLFQYAPTLTPAELDVLMQTHIATTVDHFRGKVYSWDVVNEAIANNVPQSESCGHWRCWLKTSSQVTPVNWNRSDTGDGTFYIDRAFRAAAIADPSAKLFYNEYGIHTGAGTGGKFDNVYAMLSDMLDLGVPIHGVGMQMHINNALGNKVWDPDQLANYQLGWIDRSIATQRRPNPLDIFIATQSLPNEILLSRTIGNILRQSTGTGSTEPCMCAHKLPVQLLFFFTGCTHWSTCTGTGIL